MKDELIINGVTYRAVTPEVHQDRLSGWISRAHKYGKSNYNFTVDKVIGDDTRMIEIRDSEIVVSEDDLSRIIGLFADGMCEVDCIKELFKKDGV